MVRALVLALVALAVAAPAASAHATLGATSPARGAALKAQPKQVVFRFNEPEGAKAGPQTGVAMGVAKAVGYLAIALGLGSRARPATS